MEAIGFWEYTISWFKSNLSEKPLVVDIDVTFFNIICDWFVDNKLSIHFGEDKAK